MYTPVTQFARAPYTPAFSVGWTSLQLATVHIIYGTPAPPPPEGVEEIRQLASFLAARAEERAAFTPNLVVLGDWNIGAVSGKTMKALSDCGWVVPPQL